MTSLDGHDEIILDGRRFLRAKVREQKPGVVAQYREDRAFSSRHAYVLESGEVIIDHTDLVNPDRGKLQSGVHFIVDHPMGRAVGTIAGIVLLKRKFK